jgi:AcrR family transcriptional regulator
VDHSSQEAAIPAPAGRGQGRPTRPDQTVGREALIQATIELLAELPPAKVTRAAVARRAGVDPGLIRYYFQDRHSLLLTVAERLMLGPGRASAEAAKDPVTRRLTERMRGFLAFMRGYPFIHRLMLDEIAHIDSDESRDLFQRINESGVERTTALLDEGAAAGETRAVNPLLYYLAGIGLAEFFVAATPIIKSILGENADIDALAHEYEDFICDLLLNGIARRR